MPSDRKMIFPACRSPYVRTISWPFSSLTVCWITYLLLKKNESGSVGRTCGGILSFRTWTISSLNAASVKRSVCELVIAPSSFKESISTGRSVETADEIPCDGSHLPHAVPELMYDALYNYFSTLAGGTFIGHSFGGNFYGMLYEPQNVYVRLHLQTEAALRKHKFFGQVQQ